LKRLSRGKNRPNPDVLFFFAHFNEFFEKPSRAGVAAIFPLFGQNPQLLGLYRDIMG